MLRRLAVRVLAAVTGRRGRLRPRFHLPLRVARPADVAVSPDFRRRGVASDLIRHVMKMGRKLHKVRVTLEARKSNASAISLYKHLGFVKKRTIKAYYEDGEDGLFMEVTL
ncbi:MAG TPA: GNAT family N-acetyltransferase [Candidatus Obscuribacter sp.]|nr:GNAT family N-acetyltransferase [Candidatus Obscuribacter sp.]